MKIITRLALLPLAAAGLAACDPGSDATKTPDASGNAAIVADDTPPPAAVGSDANAGGDTNAADTAASRFTAKGTFTGLLQGDYLYANFDGLTGHEAENQAMIDTGELAAFLVAHKGQQLSVTIETVNKFMDPPAETIDVVRLVDASADGVSAASWWSKLSPAAQKAAEKKADDLAAASVEH